MKQMTIAEFKTWLSENVSIIDYAERHGWLKRRHDEQSQFCCIFHNDQNPSLQVTDHFFRCYACGVKGDLISFAMTKNGSGFMETITDLADEYGIEINITRRHKGISEISKAMEKEWKKYQNDLYTEKGKSQRKAAGKIGTLAYWDPCQIGWDIEENAAVLPILSTSGKILAFTKRLTSSTTKWKHSYSDSSIIKMSEQIYGLHQCRETLKHPCTMTLTEGPKDAISFWKVDGAKDGYHSAVAILGAENAANVVNATNLSNVATWRLAFDNDSYGTKATISATMKLLMNTHIDDIQVASYTAHDPFDAWESGEKINFISAFEWLSNLDRSYSRLIWQKSYNMPMMNQSMIRTMIANKEGMNTTEAEMKFGANKRQVENESEKLYAQCQDILSGKVYGDLAQARRIMELRFKGGKDNGKSI